MSQISDRKGVYMLYFCVRCGSPVQLGALKCANCGVEINVLTLKVSEEASCQCCMCKGDCVEYGIGYGCPYRGGGHVLHFDEYERILKERELTHKVLYDMFMKAWGGR